MVQLREANFNVIDIFKFYISSSMIFLKLNKLISSFENIIHEMSHYQRKAHLEKYLCAYIRESCEWNFIRLILNSFYNILQLFSNFGLAQIYSGVCPDISNEYLIVQQVGVRSWQICVVFARSPSGGCNVHLLGDMRHALLPVY